MQGQVINTKFKEMYYQPEFVQESTTKTQTREIFWVSMTMYSMQISLERKLKGKLQRA